VTAPTKPSRAPWLTPLIAAGFLALCLWFGGREFIDIVQSGWLPGRRGPGLSSAEHPLAFWAMMAFIGAGLLCAAGMAVICAGSALQAIFVRKQPH
jgi:hypothetical protein